MANEDPSTINLSAVSSMIYNGNASICALGDSITESYGSTTDENSQSNIPSMVAKEWRPANWVGWGGQRSSSTSTENIRTFFSTPSSNGDAVTVDPGDTMPDGGDGQISPHKDAKSWLLSTDYSGNSIERWQFNEGSGVRAFGVGDWFNSKALYGRIVYYASPNSVTDIDVAVSRGGVLQETTNHSFAGSGTIEYKDIDLKNMTGDVQLDIKCGASDETGDYFNIIDIHWYIQGEEGFSYNKFMSQGGAKLEHMLSSDNSDPSYHANGYISDTNLNRYAEIYQPNIWMIFIGANDGGTDVASTTWKDRYKLLLDRCHNASNAAGIECKFLLLSMFGGVTFDSADAQAHYDSLAEIQSQGTTQVGSNHISVMSFHHLLGERNLEDFEDSDGYIDSSVHPTLRAVRLLGMLSWSAIEQAALHPLSYSGNHGRFPATSTFSANHGTIASS